MNDELARQQFMHLMGGTANAMHGVMHGENPVPTMMHNFSTVPGMDPHASATMGNFAVMSDQMFSNAQHHSHQQTNFAPGFGFHQESHTHTPTVQVSVTHGHSHSHSHSAMSDSDFHDLKKRIKSASFSSDKTGIIDVAAKSNHFTSKQVSELIKDAFTFSDDQMHALKAVHDRIVDKNNVHIILDSFTFSSDKDKAKHILGC